LTVFEYLKVVLLGIVEGVTEWLPISSTGHMILLDELIRLNASEAFMQMFLVVIQLGAILAVVVLYFDRMMPLSFAPRVRWRPEVLRMWLKIAAACVPAGVVGILWDDVLNAWFSNYVCVAIALVVFGVLFIVIEKYNRTRRPRITSIDQIGYGDALWIGVFQLIAAVFPGTSRSGATIVGALLLGISRTAAAEFTFFLAVPTMFGASLIKLVRFGMHFTDQELSFLLVGMAVAFIVSVLVIRFLMRYIKRHDFTAFGWYRIVLGALVLGYFWLS
jgi:undecaprenyl-diphosphatase